MLNKKTDTNIFIKSNLFDTTAFTGISPEKTKNPIAQNKVINDFDSSLILENIDKSTKNKAVRLNIKINTLEKNLARVNEELELINLLNLDKDRDKKEQLSRFKSYLELQINKLKQERKRFGVIYSVNGFLEEKMDLNRFTMLYLDLKNSIIKYSKITFAFCKETIWNKNGFKW